MDFERLDEQVYDFIWECLKRGDSRPPKRIIALALDCELRDVSLCVEALQRAGRLDKGLLPTNYRQWWRENVRVEPLPLPRLVPLRTKRPRQMAFWRD